jgi:sulfopyruvate decarboxylase TPP-binding subunit
MTLAKKRVQAFDAQIALQRKTNQALQLAKIQAHVRDDEEEQKQLATVPLVDRMHSSLPSNILFSTTLQWILMNSISKTRLRSADP